MMVMILERVPASTRGELTRWLIQPKTGVFIGKVSARVREKLWSRVIRSVKDGAALMLYSDTTEQGFSIQTYGKTSKIMKDFDGLMLPKTPKSA